MFRGFDRPHPEGFPRSHRVQLLTFVAYRLHSDDMRVLVTEVYRDWINSLKDLAGRARVQVRVDRLVHGNPGKHRVLTNGVCELKIDVGPGYRVYYTERGGDLIVLLAGGDKSTQDHDIKTAIALAKNL